MRSGIPSNYLEFFEVVAAITRESLGYTAEDEEITDESPNVAQTDQRNHVNILPRKEPLGITAETFLDIVFRCEQEFGLRFVPKAGEDEVTLKRFLDSPTTFFGGIAAMLYERLEKVEQSTAAAA